jgi:hypothetical protein
MEKDGIISVIKFSTIEAILGMTVKDAIEKDLNIKQSEDKIAIIQATKKSKRVILNFIVCTVLIIIGSED